MIAHSIRERAKRIPVIGPLLYHCYLKFFFGEGKILTIKEGLLSGKAWIRFMRTSSEAYIIGNYEAPVQAALAKYLRPNMVFYDVGANGGFFSLLGATLVGPNGKVVAFEPHPTTAKQLKKQMHINNMQHVDVVVAAVSDKVGTAKLSDDTSSDMLSLVNAHKSKRTIKVKTTTIDQETKSRPLPDLLKIDVEGAEIDVLRGAHQLICAKRPILLVEIHSPEIAIQYDELIAKFGYETQDLAGNKISAAKSGVRFVVSHPA
jgi:FkbM family methyltransferase